MRDLLYRIPGFSACQGDRSFLNQARLPRFIGISAVCHVAWPALRGKLLHFFLGVTVAAGLSACMVSPSLLPDDTIVTHFDNMHSQRDFWLREMEIEGEKEKIDVKSLPLTYRECAADQLVAISPPNVQEAVERFVKSDRYADYYNLVGVLRDFNADFKRQRGMELFSYAGAYCQGKGAVLPAGTTYKEMLENGMAETWKSDGHPREESPKYFDCIVKETLATFTPAELAELDSLAKARGDLNRIQAIGQQRDARFGGNSDNQVLSKCATLKGS